MRSSRMSHSLLHTQVTSND
uniref:Uncharacterized protein n=1 Tax=Anguilla anguilla TaxID=7936 RepID=A0A0E9RBV2_ANGAN